MKKLTKLNRCVCWVMSVVMLLTSGGCGTSGPVVRKNTKDLKALEETANQGRKQFFNQDYATAGRHIEPLSAELHVNKPLYECELASIAMMAGDTDRAEAHIKEAIGLLEGLHDAGGEKAAASIWGSENKKVYKGDPYERALLYTFYGTFLLNRGETDNALAAFRRALLMDGDTQQGQYQSDFGLIQFLAAKCYDLRGEPGPRDAMLLAAFDSAMAVLTAHETASKRPDRFLHAIEEEFAVFGAAGEPPSPWISALASWGGIEKIRSMGGGVSEEALAWLEQNLPADKGLGFNTLLVGWDGFGPSMARTGEYGEKRIIITGAKKDTRQAFSVSAGGGKAIDGWPWLGNVTFQASTRGGREMDNILARQAALKAGLDKSGNLMLAGGLGGAAVASSFINNNSNAGGVVTLVFLGIAVVGMTVKLVQRAITPEADTRCWQCLPHELVVVPVTLPDGLSELSVNTWIASYPTAQKTISIERKPEAPITVAHLSLPHADDPLAKLPSRALLMAYAADHREVDADGDGEISHAEYQQTMRKLLAAYDSDRDGTLADLEWVGLQAAVFSAMRKRLGFAH